MQDIIDMAISVGVCMLPLFLCPFVMELGRKAALRREQKRNK